MSSNFLFTYMYFLLISSHFLLIFVLLFSYLLVLKALFNNVSTLKNLSCMALHAISVFDKV